MNKRLLINFIVICLCMVQLLVLGSGFLVFSSTMKIFPWYEPLTLGAGLVLFYLIPIQAIIAMLFIFVYKKWPLEKFICIVPVMNLIILISGFLIAVVMRKFHDNISSIYVVLEIFMVLTLIFSSMKWVKTNI